MSRRQKKASSSVSILIISIACVILVLALSGIALFFRDENAESGGMSDERIREIQERYR